MQRLIVYRTARSGSISSVHKCDYDPPGTKRKCLLNQQSIFIACLGLSDISLMCRFHVSSFMFRSFAGLTEIIPLRAQGQELPKNNPLQSTDCLFDELLGRFCSTMSKIVMKCLADLVRTFLSRAPIHPGRPDRLQSIEPLLHRLIVSCPKQKQHCGDSCSPGKNNPIASTHAPSKMIPPPLNRITSS